MTSAANPSLRADLTIIERTYRGVTNYVVKDRGAQKYYRFGPIEISVMRRLDGRHSPAEIAASLAEDGIRLSAEAIGGFTRKMGGLGFLEQTIAEKSILQMERLRAARRKRQRSPFFRGELLRMRWTFGDPDALLERVMPLIRWMFTPAFIAASVALFVIYLVILGREWSAFSAAVQSTYSPSNLTLARGATLWVTSTVVILIHELGHGFTCKHFGGEVRELGFMVLYFQPAFYCNVNDAWSFPHRRSRLWVTAAGTWIEMLVTVLATLVWSVVTPGTLVADVAVATMLIGGVTTIVANANPLLPLDGYFALTDWLEIPNLRHRAFAHFAWWFKRRVFRLDLPEPSATVRERRVFLTYGVLASTYIAVMFTVLALIGLGWSRRAFGGIGVAAGATALFLLLRPRIMEWGRVVLFSLRAQRAAWSDSPRRWLAVFPLGVLAMMAFLPWTLTTNGTFVIRPAMSSMVSAPDSAIVAKVFVSEGTRIEAGAPVVGLVNRALERSVLAAARAVDSSAIAETAARAAGRSAEAERFSFDRQSAVAHLAALETRVRHLTVRAMVAGVVLTPRPEDLVGRRVGGGDSLLVVAALDSVEARVWLSEGGATRVQPGQVVHLVSYEDVSAPWTSRVTGISIAGAAAHHVEARVRRAADGRWRPGATGEASIELRRSNLLGALWWKTRQLIRTDLWL